MHWLRTEAADDPVWSGFSLNKAMMEAAARAGFVPIGESIGPGLVVTDTLMYEGRRFVVRVEERGE